MNVFLSYAHEDETLRAELEVHLALLKHEGKISVWHDRQILAGQEWAGEIDDNLVRADVILFLVSPPFMASEYCWEIEMTCAMERHEIGEARVIPIILRPVDWHSAPFGKLQALPRDGSPVTRWPDRDEAFLDVAKGLRAVIEDLERRSSPPASELPSSPSRPSPSPSPPVHREAAALWREKLEYLLEAEAIATEPAQKFALKKQIEEARAKIRELGEGR